jgi:Fe-S oxidoreductase
MSESGERISYLPTEGLTYDPSDAAYWDPAALDKEIERTFEICHGCRMCFKYCDSFPSLFRFIDENHDGNVAALTSDERDQVFGQCFQCKLCEVQCPYTPRDGHEFQLDFPRLAHRYEAQKRKEHTPPLGRRLMANPDGAAKWARRSFGMANAMNRVKLHRWFMEKVLGVHREKLLPPFAGKTFERWAEQQGHMDKGLGGEVVLFPTCYVQNNEPEIGRDTVEVFEHNGVDLRCTAGLACCGMPAWEQGDLEALRSQAKQNLDVLEPYVDAGAKVVAINPTCSMMMRREYPDLVAQEDKARAARLAEAIRDPSEFLWAMRDEARFRTDFKSRPGESVAYHTPCHLRAQAIGFRGRDLMRKIPGVTPKITMECCGHDGTYAMTKEGFEPSQRIGKKSFDGMKSAQAEIWVTDCPLAAIQFEQHGGVKAMHPMSVLARAYRADGFPDAVPPPDDETPQAE